MLQRTHDELETAAAGFRDAPSGAGRVAMVLRRPQPGEREILDEAHLTTTEGVVGDSWISRGSSRTEDGSPHPDMQLNLMNVRVARFLAHGDDERMALAGDQLYLDFDIGADNAPPGTRLAVGTAIIEITAEPHRGCVKFTQRFGIDAHRFVNSDLGMSLRARGVNAKVVVDGIVRPGDPVTRP